MLDRRHLLTGGALLAAGALTGSRARGQQTQILNRASRAERAVNIGSDAPEEQRTQLRISNRSCGLRSYRIAIYNEWWDDVIFGIFGIQRNLQARAWVRNGQRQFIQNVKGGDRVAVAWDCYTELVLDAVVVGLNSNADFYVTRSGTISLSP